jgi:hypothetical protein
MATVIDGDMLVIDNLSDLLAEMSNFNCDTVEILEQKYWEEYGLNLSLTDECWEEFSEYCDTIEQEKY